MTDFGSVHSSPRQQAVRVSQRASHGCLGGGYGWFVSRSTRSSGPPARAKHQYISCGSYVPVVVLAAVRAGPLTDLKRHLRLHYAAVRASLATRRPAITIEHLAPIPGGFVGDLPLNFVHCAVADRLGQARVERWGLHPEAPRPPYAASRSSRRNFAGLACSGLP